jgi:hypothetical protein
MKCTYTIIRARVVCPSRCVKVHGLSYMGGLPTITIRDRKCRWYRCILAIYIRIDLLGPVFPLVLTPHFIHVLQIYTLINYYRNNIT